MDNPNQEPSPPEVPAGAPAPEPPPASPLPAPPPVARVLRPIPLPPLQRQSGLGIASFSISILVGLGMLLALIVAGIIRAEHPTGAMPFAAVIGIAIFSLAFLAVVSLGLGIAGLVEKDRRKLLAILGVVFSGCALLLTLSLFVAGLVLRHR